MSFLIPARDAAETVQEALESALAQTVRAIEVVLVDDGSTDGTAALAEAIAARDPRVRVLRRPAEGLVAALNAGAAACRAPYLARLDADDRAHPDRVARQLEALDADPTLGVVDGQVAFFRDDGDVPGGMQRYADWVNRVVQPEDFSRALLIESPVVHPAATLRASALRAVDGYRDGPFPEDYDLWLRLHAAGWRLRKIPEVLVEMRDRPQRLTRTHPRYGKVAFREARRAHLTATLLARPRRLWLWAARKERRAWLPWLLAQGHDVVATLDADPAADGRARLGVPVRHFSALPEIRAELGLVALGVPDWREDARVAVAGLWGGAEGVDWVCIA